MVQISALVGLLATAASIVSAAPAAPAPTEAATLAKRASCSMSSPGSFTWLLYESEILIRPV